MASTSPLSGGGSAAGNARRPGFSRDASASRPCSDYPGWRLLVPSRRCLPASALVTLTRRLLRPSRPGLRGVEPSDGGFLWSTLEMTVRFTHTHARCHRGDRRCPCPSPPEAVILPGMGQVATSPEGLPAWAARMRAERAARGWSQSDAVRALQAHAGAALPGTRACCATGSAGSPGRSSLMTSTSLWSPRPSGR